MNTKLLVKQRKRLIVDVKNDSQTVISVEIRSCYACGREFSVQKLTCAWTGKPIIRCGCGRCEPTCNACWEKGNR